MWELSFDAKTFRVLNVKKNLDIKNNDAFVEMRRLADLRGRTIWTFLLRAQMVGWAKEQICPLPPLSCWTAKPKSPLPPIAGLSNQRNRCATANA